MESNQRPKKVPPQEQEDMYSSFGQNAIVVIMITIAAAALFHTAKF